MKVAVVPHVALERLQLEKLAFGPCQKEQQLWKSIQIEM
jgi:hypothetical protein